MDFKDATAMAQAVRAGLVSAEELIIDSIAKIERLNPAINAVVDKQYKTALSQARSGHWSGKPFGGVPILLKDLGQNQAGQLSTSGSQLLANHSATQTDYFVRRLESLGFIVLGRTNTPEFGFKNISDSRLHGVVHLPCDKGRNAGGSSGGAAAAVASGMVPIAAASDGGGSIRIPASFNGLIGLKPSRGRMPVGPGNYRGWQGASVHFALTRSVRDTRFFLQGMQVYQPESPFPLPLLPEKSLQEKLKRRLKIAYTLASPIGSAVSEDAQKAVLEAVAVLNSLGHDLVELPEFPLDGQKLVQSYYLMNSVETAQMFDEIEAGLKRSMSIDDMELMTWAIYQSGQAIPAKLYAKTLQDWDVFSAKMAEFHKTYDLLLTPTVADVPPLHGQFNLAENLKKELADLSAYTVQQQQDLIWEMFAESLALTPFTMFANLTGQPAISLPTYETKTGLPIGVQFMASKGGEALLLQLSEQLEEGGYLKIAAC